MRRGSPRLGPEGPRSPRGARRALAVIAAGAVAVAAVVAMGGAHGGKPGPHRTPPYEQVHYRKCTRWSTYYVDGAGWVCPVRIGPKVEKGKDAHDEHDG